MSFNPFKQFCYLWLNSFIPLTSVKSLAERLIIFLGRLSLSHLSFSQQFSIQKEGIVFEKNSLQSTHILFLYLRESSSCGAKIEKEKKIQTSKCLVFLTPWPNLLSKINYDKRRPINLPSFSVQFPENLVPIGWFLTNM